eukprot:scaffold1093_cov359-Prasinococcus_capsulatus_cf.AAC.17
MAARPCGPRHNMDMVMWPGRRPQASERATSCASWRTTGAAAASCPLAVRRAEDAGRGAGPRREGDYAPPASHCRSLALQQEPRWIDGALVAAVGLRTARVRYGPPQRRLVYLLTRPGPSVGGAECADIGGRRTHAAAARKRMLPPFTTHQTQLPTTCSIPQRCRSGT